MKKIVILDAYALNPGDISWEPINKFGNVFKYDRTNFSQIIERSLDATYIFTNKTPLTKETLEKCKNLKFIGVLATGYNVVDTQAAKDLNITVCNVPTYSTSAVSQLVFAFILEICHNIAAHSKAVLKGDWANCKDFSFWHHPLWELQDKTLGIIGYGSIGQKTASIATAFGMKVLAYSPSSKKHLETENIKIVSLDEVFKHSDIISIHCPLTDESLNLINKDSIVKMKDNVIIINTSRGAVINEKDLADGLNCGKVLAAGIDVVSQEPILTTNPLLKAKNIFITPHIGWAPKESRLRLLDIASKNLEAFINGNPINVVNK